MPKRARGAPAKPESLLIPLDEIARRGLDAQGQARKGRTDLIRVEVANDWRIPVSRVLKLSERWGASAEGLLRMILEQSQDRITERHVVEALRGWRGQPSKQQKKGAAPAGLHVLEFDLVSYFEADARAEPPG